jgi:heme/copper-type cytochrome/quinol oxidase subunit 3
MGFALAAGAYGYLVHINAQWPLGAPAPNHWPGTIMLVLLLASIWPNFKVAADARKENLARVQRWLLIMSAIGLLALGVRAYEFYSLNILWNENAYGSITWFILALHAIHLITDVGDTLVLTALMFTRHVTGRRLSDASDNAFYWYFVVATWVPLYLLVYWAPRL